jgi:quercetin dioxygenase-like cupin family protein
MRRCGVLVSVAIVALLGGISLWLPPIARAQDATPTSTETMPESVTFEPVTGAAVMSFPGNGEVLVFRTTLAPGAVIPIDASDPTLGILLVESGTLSLKMQGLVSFTRGDGFADALATAEASGEMSNALGFNPAGNPLTLRPGDAVYIPAHTAGEIRNTGQEPGVGLAFLVIPSEAMADGATPTP